MDETADGTIWIVWERNSIVPLLFRNKDDAYKYRTERIRHVRHQVYIVPGKVQ